MMPLYSPPSTEWFLAKITGTTGGGYTAVEVWADGAGAIVTKSGGVQITQYAPGYPVDGATLAVDDVVLARSAPGAAGVLFELATLGGGGSTVTYQQTSDISNNPPTTAGVWGPTLDITEAGTYLLVGDYDFASGAASGADVTIRLQLYDVTNGTLIGPQKDGQSTTTATGSGPRQSLTTVQPYLVTGPVTIRFYGLGIYGSFDGGGSGRIAAIKLA